MMPGADAQKHVLLVDDDPDIRYIAEIALARVGGLAVSLAASAEAARLCLESARPDLLVLDVTMPQCDGPTFFRELRRDPRWATLPVIFLTARTSLDDVQGFLDLGVQGVVAKPFDPMTLAQQLGAMLKW